MLLSQKQWTETEKRTVWNKGKIIPEYDANIYRQDMAGAWIKYSAYGDTTNELGLGWEIDHIKPQAKGGSSDAYNLQPLQWDNNRIKNDDYPSFYTSISSINEQNIKKVQSWTYN